MQFSLTGSQENTSADLRKKVIYLQSNLTLQQVILPISQHISTSAFLQPRNDGITAWNGHCLSLKSPSSPALCRWVFLRLETVCTNHCTMGWPWDGRYRIISSTPIRWDGAHLSSAGVRKDSSAMRNPHPRYLVVQSDLTSHLVSLVAPSSISGSSLQWQQ